MNKNAQIDLTNLVDLLNRRIKTFVFACVDGDRQMIAEHEADLRTMFDAFVTQLPNLLKEGGAGENSVEHITEEVVAVVRGPNGEEKRNV